MAMMIQRTENLNEITKRADFVLTEWPGCNGEYQTLGYTHLLYGNLENDEFT